MNRFCVLSIFAAFVLCCSGQESAESEIIHFTYESHTHMLIITRQAICYVFTLTDAERAQVHTDAGLRQLELSLLGELSDPATVMHPIPHNALHSNILHACGKGMLQYYVIDQ